MRFDAFFDAIVGNPPYHKDGGGRSKIPIYNKIVPVFDDPWLVNRASFIIPDGWVKGGHRLEQFRNHLKGHGGFYYVMFRRDNVFKGVAVNASIVCFQNWR